MTPPGDRFGSIATARLLAPARWVAAQYPGLDRRTTFVGVSAAVILSLVWHHTRAAHFYAGSSGISGLYAFGYAHLTSSFLLMVLPVLAIKLFLRERLADWGLRAGRRREWTIVFVAYLLFLPLLAWVSGMDTFRATYPALRAAETDATVFWIYEGLYLVKWVSWEFFFRGFLLFGFAKRFGESAILVSTLAFCLMHFGKPELEVYASIIAGIALCRIALDGRSIFPGVILHALVAGTMDFLNSRWWI